MSWFAKRLSRLWTREKPDGKKGWGALRYLVFGGIIAGVSLWMLGRFENGGADARAAALIGGTPPPENPAAKNVQIHDVAIAAQQTKPVTLKGQKQDSLASSQVGMTVEAQKVAGAGQPNSRNSNNANAAFFGGSGNSGLAQGQPSTPQGPGAEDRSNDSIFTALSDYGSGGNGRDDGRPPVDEDGSVATKKTAGGGTSNGAGKRGGFQEPSVGGTAQGGGNYQLPAIDSLIVHDQRTAASAQPQQPATPTTPIDPRKRRFLPRGEIIPVYLMQTVETGKFPTLVEFAVAKTVWFNGKPVLPFGTRFTATAGLGVRDRITFNVDSVRRRDGLEIALSGMVLGDDKATGMKSYWIPPPTMAQVAPYIGDFAQAFADIAKAHLNATSVQVAGVTVSTQPSMSAQAQEAAVASASQALSTFISGQLSDIKERYAAYSVVVAGSTAYVQLTANTDLSALWDEDTPQGVRTVGTVNPISTESVYRQRDAENNQQQQAILAAMQQAAFAAAQPQPNNPSSQGVPGTAQAGGNQLGGQTAPSNGAIRDPLLKQ